MTSYNPKEIEKKWADRWFREKIYEPDLEGRSASRRKPFYNLMMFPYPSAEGLHVGNMYPYAGADIYGRKKRMEGYDVFEPIGLDGFGIHSENYALKIGRHPKELARESEKNFYNQLKMIGNGFAWNERLETHDPEYYKWTQWIFVQMFKHGLAYRKKATVNWCPKCLTVLADEQVLAGECERCETKVIKKELEQWFFKITDYAECLLDDLETIDWSENVKIAQKNWIGRSEGILIDFKIQGTSDKIQVFTTRPDTLFGATYMVLAPEHELVSNLKSQISNWGEVENYIKEVKSKAEEEKKWKTGIELKGIKAINPATKEEIPIWIADYVVMGYGTGAIMAVPAHDQRDFEFAKKYKLSIRQVIAPHFEDEKSKRQSGSPIIKRKTLYCILRNPRTDEYLTLDWENFGWHTFIIGGIEDNEDAVLAATREIREETGYKNIRFVRSLGRLYGSYFAAHKKENRLADAEGLLFELVDDARDPISEEEKKMHKLQWMKPGEIENFTDISSQKYVWEQFVKESAYIAEGILVNSGKFSGVDSEEAKKKITEFVGGKIQVNYHLRDWLISRQRYWGPPIPMIYCKKCEWQPVPEKDLPVLLPDVRDFHPTGTDKSPLATIEEFVKTTCPKCGGEARRETDVSDTFLDSAWYFFRYIDHKNKKEPFDKVRAKKWLPVDMYIGGAEHAVLHLLYTRFITKVFHEWDLIEFDEPFKKFRAHGLLIKNGAKMSKSKGNVVNPDEYIKAYGADVFRMYLMFLGPFSVGGDFRDAGIVGIDRFLKRVWYFKENAKRMKRIHSETEIILNQSIKKIGEDIERLHYNTAVSQLMILLNTLEGGFDEQSYKIFLKLLAPFAPFITEELWSGLGEKKSIHISLWPTYDESKLRESTKEIVIQINGKVRDRFEVQGDASEEEIKKEALSREKIKALLASRKPQRIIIVRNHLINIVL